MKISLFLLIIAKSAIAHIQNQSEFRSSNGVEMTMRNILNICYNNYNVSNPIFILGDLDDFIDESVFNTHPISIISMNDSLEMEENNGKDSSYHFKPNIIIITEDSPEKLQSNLLSLRRTQWWNYMAHFFILGKIENGCENFAEILNTTWEMNIMMSIFICSNSLNISELYTLNPMMDYALGPWEKMENIEDLNIYRQLFDRNASCQNLDYDKTKFLNGFVIKGIMSPYRQRKSRFQLENQKPFEVKLFEGIARRLNANLVIETEPFGDIPMQRLANGTADFSLNFAFINWNPERQFLFSYLRTQVVAVRTGDGYVSTLEKIDHLWSMPIRILATVTFSFFFLILVHEHTEISSAMLEIIRLLTYVSIRTTCKKLSFRMIFTGILMLMIISNGVFQGAISAFLTKPQYSRGVNTMRELRELNYTVYILPGAVKHAKEIFPNNPVIEVPLEICPEYLWNTSKAVCITLKEDYYEHYADHLTMTLIEEPLKSSFFNSKCRDDWPLHDRMNNMMVRMVESGLLEYWFTEKNHIPMLKRRANDMGLLLPKYQPVELKALDFVFALLVIGLSLATVVFFMELIFKEFNIE